MEGFIRDFLDKLIIQLKRETFFLDRKIPLSYLCFFFVNRILNILYACVYLKTLKRICVHYSVVIKCKSKFFFGDNVSLLRGCYIDALSKNGIVLGNNVSIGKYTTIECTGSLRNIGEGLKVGNNVGLGSHGFFGCAGGVEIGDNTIFGNFVSIHSENHNFSDREIPIRLQGINRKGIKIGSDCWIGAKSTILDGAIIGNGCIIAAGSVVTAGKYEDYGIYGGVPAKLLKSR